MAQDGSARHGVRKTVKGPTGLVGPSEVSSMELGSYRKIVVAVMAVAVIVAVVVVETLIVAEVPVIAIVRVTVIAR